MSVKLDKVILHYVPLTFTILNNQKRKENKHVSSMILLAKQEFKKSHYISKKEYIASYKNVIGFETVNRGNLTNV